MGSLIPYSKRVEQNLFFLSSFFLLLFFFIIISLLLSISGAKKSHRFHFRMLKTALMCLFLMGLSQGNVLKQSDPGDQIAKMEFDAFDQDHDGIITTKDMRPYMRAIGRNPTDEDIQRMIDRVDADGNGSIEYPEYFSHYYGSQQAR